MVISNVAFSTTVNDP